MEAAGSGPRIRTARVVVNSHASPPRGVHRNNWWSNGVTLPARRSCKDRLHLVLAPWCPDVVSSHALLRFRQALSPDQLSERWRGRRSSKPGLRSGAPMLDRRATSALVGHRRIELRMPKAQALQTRSVTRLGMTRI